MTTNRPSLSLVVIRSADLERSRRFYDALGLPLSLEKHGSGPEHLAAELDGVVFEIYPLNDSPTTGARIGFRVTSIEAAISAAKQFGAAVASPPKQGPWGMRAVVVDPDGHRVELTERI
jgi:lactoylglutathione lyase